MTQITEKVTAQRLDTMYGNFVKMTDWVLKGTASQHPMPAPYKALFDAAQHAQDNAQTVQEQTKLIGALQQRLAQQDGRIAALETTLQSVNQTLAQLVEIANRQAQQATQATPAESEPVAAQPVAPAPVAAQPASAQTSMQAQTQLSAAQAPAPEQELADLSVIDVQAKPVAQTVHAQAVPQQAAQPVQTQPTAAQAVSPNEQAIQVSAAAVDAGNLDPASYAALDAEIAALTGALK